MPEIMLKAIEMPGVHALNFRGTRGSHTRAPRFQESCLGATREGELVLVPCLGFLGSGRPGLCWGEGGLRPGLGEMGACRGGGGKWCLRLWEQVLVPKAPGGWCWRLHPLVQQDTKRTR